MRQRGFEPLFLGSEVQMYESAVDLSVEDLGERPHCGCVDGGNGEQSGFGSAFLPDLTERSVIRQRLLGSAVHSRTGSMFVRESKILL